MARLAFSALLVLQISHFTSPSTEASQDQGNEDSPAIGHFSDPSAKSGVYKHIEDMAFIDPPHHDGEKTKRNAVIYPRALWPNAQVPYVISSDFSESQRDLILRGMRHWEDNTCIRFFPRTNEQYYIYIISGDGCYSYVGRLGRSRQPQGLSLGPGCVYFSTAVHEFGHAIGFYHEHTRPDRDDYISVITDNIRNGRVGNFRRKFFSNTLGYGYDYASIMHYSSYTFSKSYNKPTLVAKDEGIVFGSARELSPLDIVKANRLYECVAGSHPPISTFPPSTQPLTLPDGITCGEVFNETSGTFDSSDYISHVTNQSCAWVIKIPDGYYIRLRFPNLNLVQSADCSKNFVQVFNGRSIDESDAIRFRRAKKFCHSSQVYTYNYVYRTIATVYFHTDGTNFGASPQGLRVEYSTLDINECHSHRGCQRCTNLPGSYRCECNDGYYHSPAANTCYDVNECAYDNGGCEHVCNNSGGSYRCQCINGYYLQNDNLSCSQSLPKCPALTNPANGRVSAPTRTVGVTATYSCNSGYTLIGSLTRTCQFGGTWSGSAPVCNRNIPIDAPRPFFRLGGNVYQDGSSCPVGDIGEGDGAALLCVTDSTTCCQATSTTAAAGEFYYPDGRLVGVRASGDSFYRNRGRGYIRLNRRNGATTPLGRYRCDIPDSNGVTRSIFINIVAITCPVLSSPANGGVSAPTRTVGSVATYTCSPGYTLNGGATRVCQSSGQWSGSQPSCQLQQCPILSNPTNGIVLTSSRLVGGRATYTCNSGYTPKGSSTRACQSGGTWSGSAPTCNRNAPRPFFRIGGNVYQDGSNCPIGDIGEGDGAALLCVTDSTTCCQSPHLAGEFYYPDGRLVGVRASGDSFYRNRGRGYIRLNRRFGATTPLLGRYRCDIPDSNGVARSVFINIVADPPVVTCPVLSSPANGGVSAPTRTVGSVATYTCSPEYTLNGGATRVCQSSGQWSGSQPSCQSPPTIAPPTTAFPSTAAPSTTPPLTTTPPTTEPITPPITTPPTTEPITPPITTPPTNDPTTVEVMRPTTIPDTTTATTPPLPRTGHIQSPNWPETYPVNINQQWVIECPPSTTRISISLNNQPFWIGGQQHRGCPKDWVTVYGSATKSGRQFGPYCSNVPPTDFEVTSDRALVVFHAGPKHHPTRTGFRLTYVCHP